MQYVSPRPIAGFWNEHQGGNSANTWTLTTGLGFLLAEAELAYGSRDRTWTILGIEFGAGRPLVWFPACPSGDDHIAIRLSEIAANNIQSAVFELAHEVIHLLSPTQGNHANVLEEGLATLNQHAVSQRLQLGLQLADAHYLSAERALKQLLLLDPEAIRHLRQGEPCMPKISASLIRSVVPGASLALAEFLATPFSQIDVIGSRP